MTPSCTLTRPMRRTPRRTRSDRQVYKQSLTYSRVHERERARQASAHDGAGLRQDSRHAIPGVPPAGPAHGLRGSGTRALPVQARGKGTTIMARTPAGSTPPAAPAHQVTGAAVTRRPLAPARRSGLPILTATLAETRIGTAIACFYIAAIVLLVGALVPTLKSLNLAAYLSSAVGQALGRSHA